MDKARIVAPQVPCCEETDENNLNSQPAPKPGIVPGPRPSPRPGYQDHLPDQEDSPIARVVPLVSAGVQGSHCDPCPADDADPDQLNSTSFLTTAQDPQCAINQEERQCIPACCAQEADDAHDPYRAGVSNNGRQYRLGNPVYQNNQPTPAFTDAVHKVWNNPGVAP